MRILPEEFIPPLEFILTKHSCGILCKTTVDVLPKTCVPSPPLTFVWFVIQCNLKMSVFVVKPIESTTLLGQLKFVELFDVI